MSETEPELKPVRAVDVEAYRWGVWSSIEGGKPFVNQVMSVRWSEDGERVWLGLDSHNFLGADPDEILEMVPIEPKWIPERPLGIGPRPPRKAPCPHCGTLIAAPRDPSTEKDGRDE